MDCKKIPSFLYAILTFLLIFVPVVVEGGGGVFRVKRKLINDHKKHEQHRPSRILASKPIDIYTGGNISSMFWYTEIAIGTPPQNLTVQIDTGSHLLWVNCDRCKGCPVRNETLGIKLTPYNPKISKSSRIVARGESTCDMVAVPSNKNATDGWCKFNITYMDNTMSTGYFVTDLVRFNQLSGNQQNQPVIANITFGCATHVVNTEKADDLTVRAGIEGIIGFMPSNKSLLSQMASSGKVRNEFAHCLDANGGIFAIGHVVHPKVDMVPLLQDPKSDLYSGHYTIMLESLEVDGEPLKEREPTPTIIDSGATFGYITKKLSDFLIEQISSKISSKLPEVRFYKEATKNITCCDVDRSRKTEDFPVITFRFSNSVTFQVPANEYFRLFFAKEKEKITACFGWTESDKEYNLLGDLFLRNKLVVYDVENKLLGFKHYNCSSSIEVEDETTSEVCSINAHNFSAALN